MIRLLLLALAVLWPFAPPVAAQTMLDGHLTQGGMVTGRAAPGSVVRLDGRPVRVAPEGLFVAGFTRDAPPVAVLTVTGPDGKVETNRLTIRQRRYPTQRIDGLPPRMVTPPLSVLARIRRESDLIRRVRQRDTAEPLFRSGFVWPVRGRITGVYGSGRILNGVPRRPHFGIDIAGPRGTPVAAPADGIVALAEPDLYYTGGTIILDHGHGLSSALLHLREIRVAVGERVRQGQAIATLGSSGRSTGPHLDWRVNWFDRRLDPALLAGPMPADR